MEVVVAVVVTVDSVVRLVSMSTVVDTSVEVLISARVSEVERVVGSAVVTSAVTVPAAGLRQLHASDILAAGRRLRLGSVRSRQLTAGLMHTGPPQPGVGIGALASRPRLTSGAPVVDVVVTVNSIVEVKLVVAVVSVVTVLYFRSAGPLELQAKRVGSTHVSLVVVVIVVDVSVTVK
jgi:hypothetical protein